MAASKILAHKKEALNLLLCGDSNYAMPMAVTAKSAFQNCTYQGPLHLYIIEGGIPKDIQNKIESSIKDPRLSVFWIHLEVSQLSRVKTNVHLNASAYIRLLMPDLLPQDLNRVIYLDSDLVVNGDLTEIWEADLGSRALMACRDQGALLVSSKMGLINYQALGIPSNTPYFNSGVMLVNLKKWRSEKISQKLLRYAVEQATSIRWADQDCLNATLWNDWAELDPHWNIQSCVFNPWPKEALEKRFQASLKNLAPNKIKIIHYSEADKPWKSGCLHPYTRYFFLYVDKTEWKGWRPPFFSSILQKNFKKFTRRIKIAIKSLLLLSMQIFRR